MRVFFILLADQLTNHVMMQTLRKGTYSIVVRVAACAVGRGEHAAHRISQTSLKVAHDYF